jgi:hypothetical protein
MKDFNFFPNKKQLYDQLYSNIVSIYRDFRQNCFTLTGKICWDKIPKNYLLKIWVENKNFFDFLEKFLSFCLKMTIFGPKTPK